MEKIKNFAIFKNNEKKNEKQPDYTISVKMGDKYVTAGGAWIKDSAKGKYFSCQLNEVFQDRSGFYIEVDVPKVETEVNSSEIPF